MLFAFLFVIPRFPGILRVFIALPCNLANFIIIKLCSEKLKRMDQFWWVILSRAWREIDSEPNIS